MSANTHRHQCGDIEPAEYKGPDLSMGCGFVFEHGNENHGIDAQHMCPQCGRGPWLIQLPEDSAEVASNSASTP